MGFVEVELREKGTCFTRERRTEMKKSYGEATKSVQTRLESLLVSRRLILNKLRSVDRLTLSTGLDRYTAATPESFLCSVPREGGNLACPMSYHISGPKSRGRGCGCLIKSRVWHCRLVFESRTSKLVSFSAARELCERGCAVEIVIECLHVYAS